jgi:hypothetical protein
MVSYSVDGIRTLSNQKEGDARLHLFLLRTRILICSAINFVTELTQDGMLRRLCISEVNGTKFGDSIVLSILAPAILTGKEEYNRRNALILKKELHYWSDAIHPHPPKNTHHELNVVEVSSIGLRLRPTLNLHIDPGVTVYKHTSLRSIYDALREVMFNPFSISNVVNILINFKVNYRFSKMLGRYMAFIEIDDKDFQVDYNGWVWLCKSIAMAFNEAKGFQPKDGENVLDHVAFVHTSSTMGSMEVTLFLGEDGRHISTDVDYITDITADDLLADEELMSDSD